MTRWAPGQGYARRLTPSCHGRIRAPFRSAVALLEMASSGVGPEAAESMSHDVAWNRTNPAGAVGSG